MQVVPEYPKPRWLAEGNCGRGRYHPRARAPLTRPLLQALFVFVLLSACTATRFEDDTEPKESRLGSYFFDYETENGEAAGLIQVFDDGRQTYLQFQEAPPPQTQITEDASASSASSEVPTRRWGHYLIVDGQFAGLQITVGHVTAHVTRNSDHKVPHAGMASQGTAGATPADCTATGPAGHDATAEIARLHGVIAGLRSELDAVHAGGGARPFVVLFADNSARLSVDPERLRNIVDAVRDAPSVSVEGFTDAFHADGAGEHLASRRASRVRDALLAGGVPPDRISVTAYAAGHFAADNTTSEGKEANRRVEIRAEPVARAIASEH